ncbi:UPF0122 protein [Insulibacter thermoxylanivorax]|uniref:UPF0122 protein PRECH8_10570 n=1 Tax=Insulibacter thermoxylanivorax TaxID=2749268 RepID=A0A916VFT1_9BACL|nr:putative DNA-binding protein [Insulibacter thermoxylanivorax]GFR37761.1 UPF0122 protein [Insulibacter thermoxylanivorax]
MVKHASEQEMLAKTTRMNLLFDWYGSLLTERQRTYMQYYFHDDYSLSEIAAEFAVSRQAVYDQLKRTEAILEDYEDKLGLLSRHEQRQRTIHEMREIARQLSDEQRTAIERLLMQLEEVDRT